MRLLSLLLLLGSLAFLSGCEEKKAHAQTDDMPAIGWTSSWASSLEGRASAGVLQIGTASPCTTRMSWRHAEAGEKCHRCARALSGPHGKNPQTTVWRAEIGSNAPVWSGCHACLVETLERAK